MQRQKIFCKTESYIAYNILQSLIQQINVRTFNNKKYLP